MMYYVAYFFVDEEGERGYGGIALESTKGLKTPNDIDSLKEHLKKTNNFKDVLILNWKELEPGDSNNP